jgi:hypothetical protein
VTAPILPMIYVKKIIDDIFEFYGVDVDIPEFETDFFKSIVLIYFYSLEVFKTLNSFNPSGTYIYLNNPTSFLLSKLVPPDMTVGSFLDAVLALFNGKLYYEATTNTVKMRRLTSLFESENIKDYTNFIVNDWTNHADVFQGYSLVSTLDNNDQFSKLTRINIDPAQSEIKFEIPFLNAKDNEGNFDLEANTTSDGFDGDSVSQLPRFAFQNADNTLTVFYNKNASNGAFNLTLDGNRGIYKQSYETYVNFVKNSGVISTVYLLIPYAEFLQLQIDDKILLIDSIFVIKKITAKAEKNKFLLVEAELYKLGV